ncbi:MAG TPA: HAMP domain-containing sensor histidine kinase [Chitinophagaceae bacterium]|nr:HAMP domain-containing sensor histidine kinase [Chitinophagaceae bacterium]
MNSVTISEHKDRSYISIPIRKKISLPESNDDPAQFLSALVHEVRNPLNNINLAVEALESTLKDVDLKMYFDIIMRSTTRINDLITELLTSNLAHKVRGHKSSIHHLLDEVIEMEQDRISLKNISVRKEYSSQDCEIVLDKPKMKIALTNIIINAVDAMTPQKGQLTLITKSNNGIPVIEIKDNGCGISKRNLKKIFMPNFSHRAGGLGIGLASTFRILQLNHVGIDVQSEEGSGTSFILSFGKKNKPGKCRYISGEDPQRKLQVTASGGSLLNLSPIQN